MTTTDVIREIIADELAVDPIIVTSSARFVEDLGVDSLDVVELVMRFEEEFGIEILDEDAEKLVTVGKASAYLKTKAEGSANPFIQTRQKIDLIEDKLSETGEFDSDDATDNRERVLTSIVRRRGQPEFRQMLMKIYGGACAVTGYNAEYALEAAHIRPFRGGHTNHPTNGLLLRADIHTLFDLHLLAIDTSTSKMTILLAPQLLDTPYKSLTGKPLQSPQNNSHLPNKEALDEHRAKSGL